MSLITPSKIEQKVKHRYIEFLQATLRGETFLPYEISTGKPQLKDYAKLRDAIEALQTHQQRYGYAIETTTHQSRHFGNITIPQTIVIADEKSFFALCGHKFAEYRRFQDDVHRIRTNMPQLEQWLQDNPQKVIDYHGEWDELLLVCQYFIDNPSPDCYVRELPISVHTKFVEQHTGVLKSLLDFLLPADAINLSATQFEERYGLKYDEKKLIRLRFLDEGLMRRVGCQFNDLSVRPSELRTVQWTIPKCIVVENKMTFLTLPPSPNTLAIWGSGFQVELFRDMDWLSACEIFYWGDIDAQGFQILSQWRSLYSQVTSIMMDAETLTVHQEYIVEGTPTSVKSLSGLTLDESFLFQQLSDNNQRLEQERIHYLYTKNILHSALT